MVNQQKGFIMKKINLPLIKPILPPATIATKIGGNLIPAKSFALNTT